MSNNTILTNFYGPLEQFEINYIGPYFNIFTFTNSFLGNLTVVDLLVTNSLLYLIFVFLIIIGLFSVFSINTLLIQNNLQHLLRMVYNFVFSLVQQQIGRKGYAFFPLIMTLFMFILVANLIGLTLYSFTLTSHVTVAFTLSFSFFIAIVIIGLLLHKLAFFQLFMPPAGSPVALVPFLIVIEIISYLSRPFSLGIRLFANMMSGHTLLAILANFAFGMGKKNFILLSIPIVLIVAIVGLETMIAILQAYVFTVLICIYLNDSIAGSH